MEGREKQTGRKVKVWIKEVLRPEKRGLFGTLLFLHMSAYCCDFSQPTFILPVTRSHTFLPSLMCTEDIKREPMSQSHWPPLFHRSQLLGELGQRLDQGERPPRNWSLHTLAEFQQQSDKISSWSEGLPLWQLCTQGSQPCSISLFILVYKHPPEEHIQWAQLGRGRGEGGRSTMINCALCQLARQHLQVSCQLQRGIENNIWDIIYIEPHSHAHIEKWESQHGRGKWGMVELRMLNVQRVVITCSINTPWYLLPLTHLHTFIPRSPSITAAIFCMANCKIHTFTCGHNRSQLDIIAEYTRLKAGCC